MCWVQPKSCCTTWTSTSVTWCSPGGSQLKSTPKPWSWWRSSFCTRLKTETHHQGYGETLNRFLAHNADTMSSTSDVFVFLTEDERSSGAPAVGDHVQLLPGAESGRCPSAHVLRPLQPPTQPGGWESHVSVEQAGVHGDRCGKGSHLGMCGNLVAGGVELFRFCLCQLKCLVLSKHNSESCDLNYSNNSRLAILLHI